MEERNVTLKKSLKQIWNIQEGRAITEKGTAILCPVSDLGDFVHTFCESSEYTRSNVVRLYPPEKWERVK